MNVDRDIKRRSSTPNRSQDKLHEWHQTALLQFVAEKTEYALSKGLKVILCVGETLEQRESNQTFDVISKQASSCPAVEASSAIGSSVCFQWVHQLWIDAVMRPTVRGHVLADKLYSRHQMI